MTKQKIPVLERKEDYIGGLEEKLGTAPLVFIQKKEIEKHKNDIKYAGLYPSVIKVLGNEIGVVMKQELRGALLDPSSDDLDTLTSAANSYINFASEKYGEKAKIPAETSFGRFIEDSKINSLIMNILRFPTKEINQKKMEEYGLNKVLELANNAYQAFCNTAGSLDLGGGSSYIETIGGESKTYSGNSDSVDLSSDVCEAGSHHKLNLKTEKIQKDVQKNIPVFSKEYEIYEKNAVDIMRKHNLNLTEQTATNLFRMLINLGGVYNYGKALPIK